MLHFLIFMVAAAFGASVGELGFQFLVDRLAERRRKR